MVLIPWQSLSAEALQGVVDAYILREGTDYTEAREGPNLDAKRDAVMRQLRNGQASIVFSADEERVDVCLTAELPDSLKP